MRLQKHDEHCKAIADRLESIVSGCLFTDDNGDEWAIEYEPAYGYDMYVCRVLVDNGDGHKLARVAITTTDGETYTRSDTGEIIDDIEDYMHPVDLYSYFEDSIYNTEYRVAGRDEDPSSVCVMIACGGPNIYLDTKTGDVELYWWSESGRYPMARDVVAAIDEFMNDLYWC